MARLDGASHGYSAIGSRILELAWNAHRLFLKQNPTEQVRLPRT
jgi:hypothetical protein